MLERRILELESECEELHKRERANEEQFRRELEQWSLKARTALDAAQTGRITAKEREDGLKRKIKESDRELTEMKLEIEQLKRAQNRQQADPEYELRQQRYEAKIKILEEKVKESDEHLRRQEIRLKGCELQLVEERTKVDKEKEIKEAAESAVKQKDNQITKMQKIIEDSMNRERISDLKRRDIELDRRKVETEKDQAIRKRDEVLRQREIVEEEKEQQKDQKNEIKEMYNDLMKRYQLLKESHTALEAQILDQSSQIQELSKQLVEKSAKPLQDIHSDTQHILKDTDKIIQQQTQQAEKQNIKDASLVPKIDHMQLQNNLEARMEELIFSRKECAQLKDQQADLKTQLQSLRLEIEKLKKRNVSENQIDCEQKLQMKTANELAMQAIIAERIAQMQSKCDDRLSKYKKDFDGIVKLCSNLKEKNGEMESEIASLNKHIAAQNAFIMNQQHENQELWDKINSIHPMNKRILINQQTQHHLSDIANRQYKLEKQMKMIPTLDEGFKEGFGDIRAAERTFKKKVIDLCDHISPESHQFIHADTLHYY